MKAHIVLACLLFAGSLSAQEQPAPQRPPELTGTVSFDVGSTSGRVERIAVQVGDGGTGRYKAILTGDPSLPTHAIYRPRDLKPFGGRNLLPIVAFGNGGCRSTSGEFRNFLSEIASHGFLVIAIGPAAHSAVMGSEAPTGTSNASQLLDGVNWAIAENARQGSPYHQKLDPAKVALMGQSCGGVQALDVSKDPRVTTTVVWNSGVMTDLLAPQGPGSGTARGGSNQPPVSATARATMNSMAPMISRVTRDRLTELHGPIAYFIGGPSDLAYSRAAADFEQINQVPVLLANRDVGHYPATYRQPNGGAFAVAGTAWLLWQLKGDQTAARMFVGDDCGLCRDSAWTIQRKNFR